MQLASISLPETIFRISPNGDKARFLSDQFYLRIKKSFNHLINQCIENFPALSNSYTAIDELDFLKTSPYFHYLHHQLQTAMRAQSVLGAYRTLEEIIDVIEAPKNVHNQITINSIGDSNWERFAKQETSRLSRIEQNVADILAPIAEKDLTNAVSDAKNALTAIASIDPELFSEISEHISQIKLFDSSITRGFSDIRTMGAIFVRLMQPDEDCLLYYYEQIIHEMAHLQLNCILAFDPLISGDRTRKSTSPLRQDPRPIFGIYHATYVSAKLSHAFYTLHQRTNNERALRNLSQMINELLTGIGVLKKFSLTHVGAILVDNMLHLAREISQYRAWSSFDFKQGIPHRLHKTMFTPKQFHEFINASKI